MKKENDDDIEGAQMNIDYNKITAINFIMIKKLKKLGPRRGQCWRDAGATRTRAFARSTGRRHAAVAVIGGGLQDEGSGAGAVVSSAAGRDNFEL
ncbi:hypothetical protein F441_22583 [Phytophthora nicotianae CJ01A1]|uniref:Uncharacterized protein n=1 Tax=Phytophthora nicotianae CJ01A1 TaxID=1317063 RepID=W2VRH1_PHYNI|nr:hypothetical protein F441_22583 [Phytophthora nicotianae CJ01A1]